MVKFYPSWFVFFLVVVLGIFFVLSSDNWFAVWIGFELSLLGFLPMLGGGVVVSEGMVKYFLIQAGGSSLFLFSFLVEFSYLSSASFLLGMALKLGVFPFYHWVPMVMSSISWVGCFLLSTFQKIGPLVTVMLQRGEGRYLVLLMGVMSVLVSGFLGFNQSYMRPLMGYSSVAHTGWLVCASAFSPLLFLSYFLFYFFVLFVLFSVFSFFNVFKVVESGLGVSFSFLSSVFILTLSGVPPFFVFFFKVGVIFFLSCFPILVLALVFGSVLSVYYYLTFVIPGLSFFGIGLRFSFPFFFLCFFSVSFVFLVFFV